MDTDQLQQIVRALHHEEYWFIFRRWSMSPEAWAAWAQAIMSALAIAISYAVSRWLANEQIRANEKLREREHSLAMAARVSPLYHQLEALVSGFFNAYRWKTLFLATSPSARVLVLDQLVESLRSIQALPLDNIPFDVIEAKVAIEANLHFVNLCFQDLNESKNDADIRMEAIAKELTKARTELERIKRVAQGN